MESSTIALIAVSSLLWAGLDAARKQLARETPTALALTAALVATEAPAFSAYALVVGPHYVVASYLWPGLLAAALNVFANLAFVEAVVVAPLSLTVPYLSLTPVLTALAAFILLGERPRLLQIAGILMVVVGAALLALRGAADAKDGAEIDRSKLRRGRWLMIAVAALWALTGPVDKIALSSASPAMHAALQTATVAASLLLLAGVRGQLRAVGRRMARPLGLLVAVACAAGALITQLYAIQRALVGLVDTVKRAVGLVGALISGRLLFHEPIGWAKIVAALIMAVGVAAVLLG